MSRFEWIVALRYLRAKRKQTAISVITVVSIIGVAAGVAALIIVLAINNGFQSTLEASLLSATAHVNILERNPEYGIEDWQRLLPQLRAIPHVVSATPGLYGQVALKGPMIGSNTVLKGVPLGHGAQVPEMLRHLKAGSLAAFDQPVTHHEYGIVVGSRLAEQTGIQVNSAVTLISYQGQLTPVGVVPSLFHFRVAGIFESGLYDLDSAWAFTSLPAAQRVLDLSDVVNTIELRLDNIFDAPSVARAAEALAGPKLTASTWMDQNRSLLNALKLEKTVSLITVSLIELVAALNILAVLVMLVMEKSRDVAILMSLGTRRPQIQRIFILQGLIIGGVGCLFGLITGYAVTTLFNRYHWLKLDEQIYAISYVPFQSHWTDGIWVTGLALLMSLLATLHPSYRASQISPAEALRYE
jgi:lipoprotein-releasing system permease protein